MATVEKSPADLLGGLAYVLAKNLPLLRRLTGKSKHIPRDEDYQEIAKRQVAHLKQSGVEKIIRHVAGSHSCPSRPTERWRIAEGSRAATGGFMRVHGFGLRSA